MDETLEDLVRNAVVGLQAAGCTRAEAIDQVRRILIAWDELNRMQRVLDT
jgi:hypothetical protein